MKARDISVSVVQSEANTLSVLITLKLNGALETKEITSGYSKVDEKSRKDIQKSIRKTIESFELLGVENGNIIV